MINGTDNPYDDAKWNKFANDMHNTCASSGKLVDEIYNTMLARYKEAN
jgi:hypothetical protein